MEIINSKHTHVEKRIFIKNLIYQIISSDLAKKFLEVLKQSGKVNDIGNIKDINVDNNWIYVKNNDEEIDLSKLKINNFRKICGDKKTKNKCCDDIFCYWKNNTCMLNIREDLLIGYINKITEEFVQNKYKAHEILKIDNYYVSDIVSYNIYTERPGEKIVILTNIDINKLLQELYGHENIPKISKKILRIYEEQNYDKINNENPLKDIQSWYVQNIIPNNNIIYRAYANAIYWLKNTYIDNEKRNLGYYSTVQTNLSNIYKSQTIDWLMTIKKIIMKK